MVPSSSRLYSAVRVLSSYGVGGGDRMADFTWPGEQLIAAAQEGDVEAAAALVSGSHPHVQRFAHSLCASPQDAEDAAQEALIILYRKIGMLRASGALASWNSAHANQNCANTAPRGGAGRFYCFAR